MVNSMPDTLRSKHTIAMPFEYAHSSAQPHYSQRSITTRYPRAAHVVLGRVESAGPSAVVVVSYRTPTLRSACATSPHTFSKRTMYARAACHLVWTSGASAHPTGSGKQFCSCLCRNSAAVCMCRIYAEELHAAGYRDRSRADGAAAHNSTTADGCAASASFARA